MLVSIPKALFSDYISNSQEPIKTTVIKRTNPYIVEQYHYKLNSGKYVIVIFGEAAQTPFGTINKDVKEDIGRMAKLEMEKNDKLYKSR